MFRVVTPQGPIELPTLTLLPLDVAQELVATNQENRGWLLIERVCTPQTLTVLDQLPCDHFGRIIVDWEKHSLIAVNDVLQLVSLIKRHRDALEADLIDKGLRLRHCPSEDFDWRDLKVIVKFLPVTSNLFSEMFPDRAGWDKQNFLLADIADSLHWLQWSKTKDGSKGRNRPQPIPRPGITPPQREGSKPKAAPISVHKELAAERYKSRSDRTTALNNVFGRK